MKKMMKRFKNQRGLTLVELLAVIVILAIVAVIAFVMIGNIIENSKKDAHIANAQQIIAAAKLYDTSTKEIDNTGVKVSTIQDEGYLDTLHDPWTNEKYGESAEVSKGENGFELSGFNGKNCTLSAGVTESYLAEKGRKACAEEPEEPEEPEKD